MMGWNGSGWQVPYRPRWGADDRNSAYAHAPLQPLTLAECLAIPPLSAATTVAGHAGLDRTVRWVHIVDVPNIEECLVGGELVLTSGISLGHDNTLQRRIIPTMARMQLAGLVVAVGPYLDRVPPPIVATADAHRIPVLELPWAVNFGDVTQAVLTAVVDRQHAMLQLSERIHRGLTQLVLQGGGLPDVARRLTTLLHRSVLILDPAFQILAGATPGREGDPLSSAEVAGRLPGDLVVRLREATRSWDLTSAVGATVLEEPGVGGVLAPIRVERRLLGSVWIDGGGQPIGQLDIVAAEHGATVAALMSYKDEAVRRAERRHERDLLDRLLSGAPSDPDRLRPATGSGLMAGPQQVIAVATPDADPERVERMAETALTRDAPGARVRWRGRVLAVVLPVVEEIDPARVASDLQHIFAGGGSPLPVGVSSIVPSPDHLGRAFNEACDAARLSPHIDSTASVHYADRMRTLRQLALAQPASPPPATSPIARLIAYDAAHGSELLATLDAYLQHDGNASAAARSSGIHRHTLLNRLDRIREITTADLSSTARLDLRLALLLHRLSASPGDGPRGASDDPVG